MRATNCSLCTRQHGWAAIHYATYFKRPQILSALIRAGANVNATTREEGCGRVSAGISGSDLWPFDKNSTALHIAARHGSEELARILKAANIDVGIRDIVRRGAGAGSAWLSSLAVSQNKQTALDIAKENVRTILQ